MCFNNLNNWYTLRFELFSSVFKVVVLVILMQVSGSGADKTLLTQAASSL